MITRLNLPPCSKAVWFDGSLHSRSRSWDVKPSRKVNRKHGKQAPKETKLPTELSKYQQMIAESRVPEDWVRERAGYSSSDEWKLRSLLKKNETLMDESETNESSAGVEDYPPGADPRGIVLHEPTQSQASIVISSLASGSDIRYHPLQQHEVLVKEQLRHKLEKQLERTRKVPGFKQQQTKKPVVRGRPYLREKYNAPTYPLHTETCPKMELSHSWSTGHVSPSMENMNSIHAHTTSYPVLQIMARPSTTYSRPSTRQTMSRPNTRQSLGVSIRPSTSTSNFARRY